jgi:hypothetical protein
MSLGPALLATAVLAAWALGCAARADASPGPTTTAERVALDRAVSPYTRDDEVDRSSNLDAVSLLASEGERTGAGSANPGSASAALVAAFLLAGVVAVLVAAATRVRSSWPA